MKYILVIGDGMADHPLDTLGGRTPLEASKKDAIDALARHGILGSVRNVPEGFAPGSDTAIMSIFGCSPRKYFFGRAPLEAAASGIRLAPGDACYRCNMVTYADEDVPFEHKHIISHSAGSIEGRESDELVTMLFDHPDFRPLAEQAGMVIHKGSSFRHLAVQSHVDKDKNVLGWINELAFAPVDLCENAMQDEWSTDIGVGCKYFSQDAVIKLAPAAGIELDENLSPAEKLKVVQALMEKDDPRAQAIFESIGAYLAYAVVLYSQFYDIEHMMMLGRVMSGKGGDTILRVCNEILADEYPALAKKCEVSLPDEKTRRVGQSVAAASLPRIK